MPKRPAWTREMTSEQLIQLENDTFLSWRRELSKFENFSMTPFEKNINIWRQLWRVVERSALVVQIVDARNIEFYLNYELQDYVAEMGKLNMLVINKSDLLSRMQRVEWALYLNSVGVNHCFFSCITEENVDGPADETGAETKKPESKQINDGDILDPQQLLQHLRAECNYKPTETHKKPVIGFVGYPNVGKSSTINSLLGQQSVRVGSTPGKTKHFQTIQLEEFVLCDCPGLVFPKVVNTAAECVLNGVFPIDQLRDPYPSSELLVSKIPKSHFQHLYNIVIDTRDKEGVYEERQCSGGELLRAFARQRGYTRASQGQPDESKAARVLLKDYVKGKLLFVEPPSGVDALSFNTQFYLVNEHNDEQSVSEEKKVKNAFDIQFFQQKSLGVRTEEENGIAGVKYKHLKKMELGDKKHKKQARRKTRDYWTATE
jgi:large subunit GTPase 1